MYLNRGKCHQLDLAVVKTDDLSRVYPTSHLMVAGMDSISHDSLCKIWLQLVEFSCVTLQRAETERIRVFVLNVVSYSIIVQKIGNKETNINFFSSLQKYRFKYLKYRRNTDLFDMYSVKKIDVLMSLFSLDAWIKYSLYSKRQGASLADDDYTEEEGETSAFALQRKTVYVCPHSAAFSVQSLGRWKSETSHRRWSSPCLSYAGPVVSCDVNRELKRQTCVLRYVTGNFILCCGVPVVASSVDENYNPSSVALAFVVS